MQSKHFLILKDNYGWGGGAYNQEISLELAPGIHFSLHATVHKSRLGGIVMCTRHLSEI